MTALLFDVDGVLCDTEHLHRKALAQAASEHGYIIPDTDTRTTVDKLRAAGVSAHQIPLVYAYKRLLFEQLISNVPTNLRLACALRTLSGRRVCMAACTNANRTSTTKLLQHLGIYGVFSTIVAASDVDKGKPAPDIYIAAMEQLSVLPSDVVVFEDSDVGVEAAFRAGIPNIIRCTTETLLKELAPWLS